jgi:hypothetical protein
LSYAGWGIWSGFLFFFLTGILGLLAVHRKNNKGMVIAVMVLSIITAAAAFQLLVASVIAVIHDSAYYDYGCSPDPARPYPYIPCIVGPAPRIAVDSLLAVLGLVEMIICIVTASMSCYGVCTCCNPYTPVTVQYVPQLANTQFVPMVAMQDHHQQQAGVRFAGLNVQQQPQQMPGTVQGIPTGQQYVANYNIQPVGNSPQQLPAYANQPVGGSTVQAPLPVSVTPQPIGMAPQQVIVAVPGQTPPTGPPAGAGMQPTAAEQPVANPTGVADTVGSDHFHHDDKKGLLESS